MILTAHEKLRRDDGFQLEKELDNSGVQRFQEHAHCTNLSGVNRILHNLHPSFKGRLKKSQ